MNEIKKALKNYFIQQSDLYTQEYYFENIPKILKHQERIPKRIDPLLFQTEFLKVQEEVKRCHECPLYKSRTNIVFGDGNPRTELMFIGEAPGENEDLQGKAFVGRAGKLLDELLRDVGLDRSQVYITNIVKCRPPANRSPNSDECAKCIHFLYRQIELIEPSLIVCLGLVATKFLLNLDISLGRMRGQIFQFALANQFHGTDVLVTYHPAAILRNVNLMSVTKDDFRKIKQIYREKSGGL